jgi:endoglucanase
LATARIIYSQPDARDKVIVVTDQQSLKFLEELTNCFGPSGFEREPARIVKRYVSGFSDKVYSDKLGSLMFEKRGTADNPIVLIPGHIDEVGFIISSINKLGFLTFNPLGGWFDQVLLGQRVLVKTEKGIVPGVIAAKPPHLLPAEEKSKVVVKEKMFVDIGASNEEEAKAMDIRIGNPVIPDSHFSMMQKKVFKNGKRSGSDTIAIGKAFDDRIGTWIAAEAVRTLVQKKISHPNTVIGAATTQEEVGLRGARTAAYVTKPDVCDADNLGYFDDPQSGSRRAGPQDSQSEEDPDPAVSGEGGNRCWRHSHGICRVPERRIGRSDPTHTRARGSP